MTRPRPVRSHLPQDGPIVVLLPHQDDEFALLPLLEAERGQGRQVVCAFLTDGRDKGRDKESREVLGRLGIPEADLHFPGSSHHFVDGHLVEYLERALDAIRAILTGLSEPPLLLVPAWEGGHADHDATHLIGLALAHEQKLEHRAWQFPIYHGKGLPGPLFRVMAPLAENGPILDLPCRLHLRHLALCLRYRSQWAVLLGLTPQLLWRVVSRTPIRLQPLTRRAWTTRPHVGRLLHERTRRAVTSGRWKTDQTAQP